MRHSYDPDSQTLSMFFDSRIDNEATIADPIDWVRPGSTARELDYMRNSAWYIHCVKFADVDMNRYLMFKLTFGGAA